jgi:plasmid stabilization system protein ParE
MHDPRTVLAMSWRAFAPQSRSWPTNPYSGYQTDDPDVRVKFVIQYPYKIFYRIRDDVVEIAHIRHTSRRPWSGGR